MSNKIHAPSFDEVIERNWPQGIKKTRQRIDVYRILYEAKEPLSAADIFQKLNQEKPKEMYAFSTVYRNLLAFEKAGIVVKTVLSTEDNALYELKQETHRHYAVCLVCHTKIPISSCPLHEISHDLAHSIPDFEVTGHQLEIYGYCSKCKKSQTP
jgi:Fur family ferric uptake transcriptional regulator